MKHYVNYMDKIDAPEELTEKLLGLEARKKPVRVYRWAAAAAAVALIVGAGALWRYTHPDNGQSWHNGGTTVNSDAGSRTPGDETYSGEMGYENLPGHGETYIEPTILPEADDPGNALAGGGYEIVEGPIVTCYNLPGLNFGHAEMMSSPDYALGDAWRDAGREEIEAILTPLWREHLGIPEETEAETFTIYEKEGSVNGFQLTVSWEGNSLDVEQQIGYNVPTCCVSPDDAYGHTDVNGVDVVTLTWCGGGSDGADDHCEVKFFVRGTGWKATIVGDNCRELASRFVRLGINESSTGLAAAFRGISAESASGDGAAPSPDERNTPAYDPNR